LRTLRRIGTHLLTAILTAGIVSLYWYGVYGGGGGGLIREKGFRPVVPVKPAVTVGPAGLAIPVAGAKSADLTNTYAQTRAGGTRVHDAIDIMAPHGTRWIYYYAHLQEYAPGLREGQKVSQGDVIGTVGSSGNASPEGPHLHFAVHRVTPDDEWHGGSPVNPYPLLAGNPRQG
jgi:murein DD-endopeptidase MepM/ murein hydrolase activator NlpD